MPFVDFPDFSLENFRETAVAKPKRRPPFRSAESAKSGMRASRAVDQGSFNAEERSRAREAFDLSASKTDFGVSLSFARTSLFFGAGFSPFKK